MYRDEFEGKFPTGTSGWDSADRWGGKYGTVLSGMGVGNMNWFLNSYVGANRTTVTVNDGLAVFQCPADDGAKAGAYSLNFTPTCYDAIGCSYTYNALANNGDENKGLYNKSESNIIHPSKVILVSDRANIANYGNCFAPAFQYMYWHAAKIVGYGVIGYVDGHAEPKLTGVTKTHDDFQNGPDWTFIYNN